MRTLFILFDTYKIIPRFGLAIMRLSHVFIIIFVVNSLLSEQSRFKAICLELYVTVDSEGHWSSSRNFMSFIE